MLYYNPPIPFLTPIILYSTLFIVILQQNSNYNIITGMNIENAICSSVISVVKGLYGQDVPEKMVQLQKTRSNFEGNLTLVVFPFLKISKKNPEQTAQEIGHLGFLHAELVGQVLVQPPGHCHTCRIA